MSERAALAWLGDARRFALDAHEVARDTDLRNRLIHSFWLIDTSIVLDIAQTKIMPLVASIDQLIAKLES